MEISWLKKSKHKDHPALSKFRSYRNLAYRYSKQTMRKYRSRNQPPRFLRDNRQVPHLYYFGKICLLGAQSPPPLSKPPSESPSSISPIIQDPRGFSSPRSGNGGTSPPPCAPRSRSTKKPHSGVALALDRGARVHQVDRLRLKNQGHHVKALETRIFKNGKKIRKILILAHIHISNYRFLLKKCEYEHEYEQESKI